MGFAANSNKPKLSIPPTNHFVEFSDESLADIDIDDLLDEIDGDINNKNENEMPIDTFVQILNSSDKQYDIPKILKNVSCNGATTVSFESIASYHQPLDSIN